MCDPSSERIAYVADRASGLRGFRTCVADRMRGLRVWPVEGDRLRGLCVWPTD